jgi:hypothetical protein
MKTEETNNAGGNRGEDREPAQKRRLVGEKSASAPAADAEAAGTAVEPGEASSPFVFSSSDDESCAEDDSASLSPRVFRHYGFACQTRAACFIFCLGLRRAASFSESSSAVLPPEIVEVICRVVVAGSFIARFSDPKNLERVASLPSGRDVPANGLVCLDDADGRQLLARGCWEDTVELWDIESRQLVGTLEGYPVVSMVAFSDRDGAPALACGSVHDGIILWDVARRKQIAKLSGHKKEVSVLAMYTSAAGLPCLASAGRYEHVMLWDLHARRTLATLDIKFGRMPCLCVFCDFAGTQFLANGEIGGAVTVWDLATREKAFSLQHAFVKHECWCEDEEVACLASFVNDDGVLMLVSGRDFSPSILIWDVLSRELIATMDWHYVEPAEMGHQLCSRPFSMVCAAGVDGRVLLVWASVWGQEFYDVFIFDLSAGEQVFCADLEQFSGSNRGSIAVFVDNASPEAFLAFADDEDPALEDSGRIQLWTTRV